VGHVLLEAHDQLRRGEFNDKLRDLVESHRDDWRTLKNDDERLKANYVVAEVFDYFGEYAKARDCLKDTARQQLEAIKKSANNGVGGLNRNLFKRQLWLAIAHAMTFYRSDKSDDFDECLRVLDVCQAAVDAVDPGAAGYFGTRARLAHTRARVNRQLHNHDEARRGFNDAMVFARQRFVQKTAWAEQSRLSSPPFGTTAQEMKMFEHQRLLCHWTIGRCLAPGLGFVDYTTGRLLSADTLLSAGYSLLRGTGDVIQRAYATLLMGAVGRARAGGEIDAVQRAIVLLDDGARVLEQHPKLKLRAAYERALAYYKIPSRRADARTLIDDLKKQAQGNARWTSSALVLESRIERLERQFSTAKKRAEEAVERAKATGDKHGELRAEALIALGEAHASEADAANKAKQLGRARESWSGAVRQFMDALNLSANNPKIAAVCHLHLAATHIAQGALFEAHQERAAASRHLDVVEHGFVKTLAVSVDQDLAKSEVLVIDLSRGSLNKDHRTAETEAFLIKRALAKTESLAEAASLLGMKEEGLRRAIIRLKEGRYLPSNFGEAWRSTAGKHHASKKR
jgi:hypothetical protein